MDLLGEVYKLNMSGDIYTEEHDDDDDYLTTEESHLRKGPFHVQEPFIELFMCYSWILWIVHDIFSPRWWLLPIMEYTNLEFFSNLQNEDEV